MKSIHMTTTFQRWRDALVDRQAMDRIDLRIRRALHGNMGDAKSVGGGVMEMRIHYGPGYRLYITERNGNLLILLAGGTKKTQTQDIRHAILLAQAY